MTIRSSFLLSAAGLVLSGCATVNAPEATLAALECQRYDCQKMYAISHESRIRGVRVVWVNPPQKPAATK